MNSSSSSKKLEGFFNGKGFYIVLFLCAAVIGVSAWMIAAGETMEESTAVSGMYGDETVETVFIPPVDPRHQEAMEVQPPEIAEEGIYEAEPTEVVEEVAVPAVSPVYMWPVSGSLEREFSMDTLRYDVTLRDWRTHDGVDIEAPLGTTVTAAHAGTVESIVNDDLYGTVIIVDHCDGTKGIYANLAETPAVNPGDWVEAGTVIGSVGTTALCEIGQGTHLHFSMLVNGESADPMNYLPN